MPISIPSNSQANLKRLRDIRGLLIDLDGVIHVGSEPTPGLSDFLSFLDAKKIDRIYVSNNSTLTPAKLGEGLRQFGIFAEPEQVLPSTIATAAYLAENFPPGARVYVLGESGLLDAVEEAGFQVANERVDAVVVGLDRNFTYRDIQVASNHILQGAKFIACNADSGAPKPDGIAPGAGAITAAIEAVTMVPPIIVGKPEPAIFLEGIRRMGLAKIQVAAIGDRLDIDVACARKAEVMGILVLTGMTDEAMVGRASTKPDLTFQDLTEFTHAWQEMLGVGSP